MNSNDNEKTTADQQRDNERQRLARQIGRLLAIEWLRNRGLVPEQGRDQTRDGAINKL
jgi:hypothetical protein